MFDRLFRDFRDARWELSTSESTALGFVLVAAVIALGWALGVLFP